MSDDAATLEPLKVHEALSLVMGDVQAVGKTGRNKEQNYNFRGIDAVVNAVGPALREHGVLVLPRVLSSSSEHYTTRNGAQMKNVTVEVEFTFVGPAGDTLACSAVGEAADSGDKATSKAHSVAFRTALLQALCIPTDEPDPDQSSHERAAPPPPEPVISTADADRIKSLLNGATADDRKAFVTRFKCRPDHLPASRLDEANDWLSDIEPIPEGDPS